MVLVLVNNVYNSELLTGTMSLGVLVLNSAEEEGHHTVVILVMEII